MGIGQQSGKRKETTRNLDEGAPGLDQRCELRRLGMRHDGVGGPCHGSCLAGPGADLADLSRVSSAVRQPLAGRLVLYAIWRNPWMFAGTDTFIDAILDRPGAVKCGGFMARAVSDPRACTTPSLRSRSDFAQFRTLSLRFHHAQELFDLILPSLEVRRVDGEHYSWNGPRLLAAMAEWSRAEC